MREGLIVSVVAGLVLLGASENAVAQESACRDEIERLAVAFFPDSTIAQGEASALAPSGSLAGSLQDEPGARKDAQIGQEQRNQLHSLLQDAIAAADRGNEQGCIQALAEARTLARDAGIGAAGSTSTDVDIRSGGTTPGVARGVTSPGGGTAIDGAEAAPTRDVPGLSTSAAEAEPDIDAESTGGPGLTDGAGPFTPGAVDSLTGGTAADGMIGGDDGGASGGLGD